MRVRGVWRYPEAAASACSRSAVAAPHAERMASA